MITQNQVKLLQSIVQYIDGHGFGPTKEEVEMLVHFNLKRTMDQYLNTLERKGCISWTSSNATMIQVTDNGRKLLRLLR